MSFAFPVLVCDIGGTNARFSLKETPQSALAEPVHVHTGDYPGLGEAIAAILPKLAARPRAAIACGAGPIVDGKLKLSNADLASSTGARSREKLNLGAGLLLNDFEAQALSLPVIPENWTRQIGPLRPGASGPRVILGPGTGLGVAALIEASGKHTPVSSEFCHMGCGPATEEEAAIWPHLERAHGRITTESVISGAGLARVYRAHMLAKGVSPDLHDPAASHRRRARRPRRRSGRRRAALLAHRRPNRRRRGDRLRRARRRDARRRRAAKDSGFPRRGDFPCAVRG